MDASSLQSYISDYDSVSFMPARHCFQLIICCHLSSKFDVFLRHGKRWKVAEWWTEKGKASVRKDLFTANCMNWEKGNKNKQTKYCYATKQSDTVKKKVIIIRCIFSILFIGRELTTWAANNCLQTSVLLQIERFSNDCRKTKTKAITPTNHDRIRQRDEPITIPCNYL